VMSAEPRERLRVDGGAGDDELEVGSFGEQTFEVAEEKINVQRAFMRLVDDQHVVFGEQRVALCLGEQDAVGSSA